MQKSTPEINLFAEKKIIAKNIAFFRKKVNMTQTELAKKLQYSNKNISKWELGETTPDIFTLKKLAVIFGTTVDTLVNPITDDNIKAIQTKSIVPTRWKVYMLMLVISIVFLITCIAFFVLKSINFNGFPIGNIFLYILPVIDLCVFIFLCCIKRKVDIVTLSLFGWLVTLCCHLSFINYPNIAYIYIITLGYQVLVTFFANLINSGKIIKLNKIIIKKIRH